MAAIALANAASAAGAADAGNWKDIPLDSCRKVQGVSGNMMGVCLDGTTLYAIGGETRYGALETAPGIFVHKKWPYGFQELVLTNGK